MAISLLDGAFTFRSGEVRGGMIERDSPTGKSV
jgi:hypothetical protein